MTTTENTIIWEEKNLIEVSKNSVNKEISETNVITNETKKNVTENEWKDKNDQPIKNWKQKMQGVWFREENRTGGTLQFPNHPLSLGRKAPEKRK